jgi:hypothetical protein
MRRVPRAERDLVIGSIAVMVAWTIMALPWAAEDPKA